MNDIFMALNFFRKMTIKINVISGKKANFTQADLFHINAQQSKKSFWMTKEDFAKELYIMWAKLGKQLTYKVCAKYVLYYAK